MELEKARIVIRHKLSFNDLPSEPDNGSDGRPDYSVLAPLVQRLRDGDATVSDALITAHMRLAFRIAGSMKRYLPIQLGVGVDDIFQAAYYGVVYGVNHHRSLTDNNLTAYLTVIIRRFCYDHIEHDKDVPVERRQLKKYIAAYGGNGSSVELSDESQDSAIEAGIVMQETLSMFQEREQRIIHMMLAAYTQPEIAKALGMNQSTVSRAIKGIQAKAIRLRILGAWVNDLTEEI